MKWKHHDRRIPKNSNYDRRISKNSNYDRRIQNKSNYDRRISINSSAPAPVEFSAAIRKSENGFPCKIHCLRSFGSWLVIADPLLTVEAFFIIWAWVAFRLFLIPNICRNARRNSRLNKVYCKNSKISTDASIFDSNFRKMPQSWFSRHLLISRFTLGGKCKSFKTIKLDFENYFQFLRFQIILNLMVNLNSRDSPLEPMVQAAFLFMGFPWGFGIESIPPFRLPFRLPPPLTPPAWKKSRISFIPISFNKEFVGLRQRGIFPKGHTAFAKGHTVFAKGLTEFAKGHTCKEV